ncbi:MAG: hypothetical protein LBQ50_03115 [Planctomycetaceae bacterium]|jgi:hypothetical protein|nr:hypothetical protein [Planctomycetaceae bacterium]
MLTPIKLNFERKVKSVALTIFTVLLIGAGGAGFNQNAYAEDETPEAISVTAGTAIDLPNTVIKAAVILTKDGNKTYTSSDTTGTPYNNTAGVVLGGLVFVKVRRADRLLELLVLAILLLQELT